MMVGGMIVGGSLTNGGGVRPDPRAPNAPPNETLGPPLLPGLERSPPSTLTLKASDTRLRI